jgi:hypothetical protein
MLNLVGYFEDADNARFGLLYETPNRLQTSPASVSNRMQPFMVTLSDLLSDKEFEPPLEIKYRLAYNLATSVFDLHSKGVIHGNLSSTNVSFFELEKSNSGDSHQLNDVDVRRPYLTSFDIFPDTATRQSDDSGVNHESLLYKHSLDPRLTPYTVLTPESRSLDLYSLAMLLLEIGLWTPARLLAAQNINLSTNPKDTSKKLASRCATSYTRAVKACWRAVDEETTNRSRPEVALQKIYGRVLNALERCCAVGDGLSDEEEDINEVNIFLFLSRRTRCWLYRIQYLMKHLEL